MLAVYFHRVAMVVFRQIECVLDSLIAVTMISEISDRDDLRVQYRDRLPWDEPMSCKAEDNKKICSRKKTTQGSPFVCKVLMTHTAV